MATFPATSKPASSLQPHDGDSENSKEQRSMINEGISPDLAKRILELESQNQRLMEENQSLYATSLEAEKKYKDERKRSEDKEEDARSLAETVKNLGEKCERLKEKYENLREGSECGDVKWKERLKKTEDKCWLLEVDNRKLQIDLREARREADGFGEKMMKAVLEEKDLMISVLVKKIEGLEMEKMRIEEELGGRVITLEETVQKWLNLTTRSNVQNEGNTAPKCISISLVDPKKENLEADEQLPGPVIPKKTDCPIVEISDSEDEDEEEQKQKQTPSFASPSSSIKRCETKRKMKGPAEKQAEAKRCKSIEGKMWETAEKMCEAINADNDLCIKSICALYRKHKCLGVWKNHSDGRNKGFEPALAQRGVALGKFLTSGNPEGRLNKAVAELQRQDPKNGLHHCKFIAKDHKKELFQIYNNNLDPLFLP